MIRKILNQMAYIMWTALIALATYGVGETKGYQRGIKASARLSAIHVENTERCLSMQKHGGGDYRLYTGAYRFINGRLHCYDTSDSIHKYRNLTK